MLILAFAQSQALTPTIERLDPRPAASSCCQNIIRFLTYIALLFGSWNHNLLGIPDNVYWSRAEPRWGYLGSESHLVVARMAELDRHGFYPLIGTNAEGSFVPYPSQVGLTGIGLSALKRSLLPVSGRLFAECFGIGFAMLTAMVFATVFIRAQMWLGAPSGDVACGLLAATPIFLPFATSLYWVPWLLFAPFALVWCLQSLATTRICRAGLFVGVGLLVMAKSLCGYEYITAVILAPVAAAGFHLQRSHVSFSRRIRDITLLISSGLIGFVAAMAFHVAQQEIVFGQSGVEVILTRAKTRIAAPAEQESGVTAKGESERSLVRKCFFEYFDQRAVSIPGFGGYPRDIPLIAIVGLATGYSLIVLCVPRLRQNVSGALASAIIVGFLASISWQVSAINHMCVHRHLNAIVFTVPFLPLAYLSIGHTIKLTSGPNLGERLGAGFLLVLSMWMAANTFLHSRYEKEDRAAQTNAENQVFSLLSSSIPGPDAHLGGAVDTVRAMVGVPASLVIEYGELDLATGRPTDPQAVMITGWVLGECKLTVLPTTRLVVTSGERIVAARIMRFRRPDIEALIKKPVPGTGFAIVVPSRELFANEKFRVFAVAEGDPVRVVELAVK